MNFTTTLLHGTRTVTPGGNRADSRVNELLHHYLRLIQQPKLGWTEHLRLRRMLGKGGQGIVYLSERRGADGFTLPVALSSFRPSAFRRAQLSRSPWSGWPRSARAWPLFSTIICSTFKTLSSAAAFACSKWNGSTATISTRCSPADARAAQTRVGTKRWDYINNVIATAGATHTRFKPGMAAAIIRECLAGLAALHREEIVHGDIKPSNIMIKRTGNAKIIDIGSASI